VPGAAGAGHAAAVGGGTSVRGHVPSRAYAEKPVCGAEKGERVAGCVFSC
jgi:hypothetical protein